MSHNIDPTDPAQLQDLLDNIDLKTIDEAYLDQVASAWDAIEAGDLVQARENIDMASALLQFNNLTRPISQLVQHLADQAAAENAEAEDAEGEDDE